MPRLRPALSLALLAVLPAACNKSTPKAGPAVTTTAAPARNTQAEYDLTRLAAELKAASPEKRTKAITMAADLDAEGEEVIPVLLTALKEPTVGKLGNTSERPDSTRETAVLALLGIKDRGKKALLEKGLAGLEVDLKHKDPSVREHTANAIGMVGPDAKGSAEALTKLGADPSKEVRNAAYRAMEKIKTVPPGPILKLMNHPNLDIAAQAADALRWLKPTGPESVPPLLEALKREPRAKEEPNDVAYIRNAAADALGNIGKGAEAAVDDLVDMLKRVKQEDFEKMVRPMKATDTSVAVAGPVHALRRIGKPAVPAVVPLLKSKEPIVRYQAAAVLSGMTPADGAEALPRVQEALEAERGLPNGQMMIFQELAAGALNLGGDQEKVTTLVIDLLKSDEEVVRLQAARLLARVGRKAAPAVPRLTELLNDPKYEVQVAAVEALAAAGPAAKDAVIELGKKAESEDVGLARAACQALRNLGPAAAPAAPSLAKALDANDQSLCIDAALALAAVGPEAVTAVGALVKHLADDSTRREERVALLQAAAAIGPPAKDALPTITKLVTDKDLAVRAAAIETLGKVGDGNPEAIKKLTDVLKDTRNTPPSAQAALLRALAGMGAKGKSAAGDVKAYQDAAKDTSSKVWAAAALTALGTDADANARVVLAALKDTSPQAKTARVSAIDAAELLGPKAKPGVPDLVEALKDKSAAGRADGTTVRDRAARTLGKLGPTAKPAVGPLADLLKDPDKGARRSAAEALGAIGPDASAAVPKLRDLARAEPDLAGVANAALDRIEPPKKTD